MKELYTIDTGNIVLQDDTNILIHDKHDLEHKEFYKETKAIQKKLQTLMPEQDFLLIENSYDGTWVWSNELLYERATLSDNMETVFHDVGEKSGSHYFWAVKTRTEEQLLLVKTILGI